MIRIEPALVVALFPHGEHGVVGRFLSESAGLVAGYVAGGRGRNLRPVLQIGNLVALDLVERRAGQLKQATVHALASNMAMLHGPPAMAIIDYGAALAAATLPEDEPQPQLYALFAALFAGAGAGTDALTLGATLVRLELALLTALGLGLDLSCCAATGSAEDLAYVSPKSRQAVSRAAGLPYAGKLLPLPSFVASGGPADARLHAARDRLAGLLQAT
jgi:DNA repair protein RecO (recombination protein O)